MQWMSPSLSLTNFPKNLRCDDGNAQTTNDICGSGACQGCPVLTDDCEIAAGTFDVVTQQCSAPTVKANGTTCESETTDERGVTLKHQQIISKNYEPMPWMVLQSCRCSKYLQALPSQLHKTLRCDDSNTQTTNDMCASGTCQGCLIITTACDSGTWDMSIGQCSATLPPNGATCDSETRNTLDVQHSGTTKNICQICDSVDVESSSMSLEQQMVLRFLDLTVS